MARSDVRETFLCSNPEILAELIVGVVPSWKHYLSAGSWLWQQVALRAVATAIEAAIAREVVETLKADSDGIREEVAVLLRRELQSLSKIMSSPGKSIEEIDHMAQNAGAVITKIVVQRLLLRAQPVFKRAGA